MSLDCISGTIVMILKPTPIKESIVFWTGALILARLVNIVTPDETSDHTKSQSYLWLIGPLGFLVAAVTVYDKSKLHSHWFFDLVLLRWIAKYLVDLIFGISLGLIVTSQHSSNIRKNIFENASKWIRKLSFSFSHLFENLMAFFGKIPSNRVMPSWDRFTPQSQIKTLEFYLKEMDNASDKQSLKFWSDRRDDTEKNGFNFRISLGEDALSKLSLKSIRSKKYLGVEFWKNNSGVFRIRTTDSSQREPKEFQDANSGQIEELGPHIKYWYSKMK